MARRGRFLAPGRRPRVLAVPRSTADFARGSIEVESSSVYPKYEQSCPDYRLALNAQNARKTGGAMRPRVRGRAAKTADGSRSLGDVGVDPNDQRRASPCTAYPPALPSIPRSPGTIDQLGPSSPKVTRLDSTPVRTARAPVDPVWPDQREGSRATSWVGQRGSPGTSVPLPRTGLPGRGRRPRPRCLRRSRASPAPPGSDRPRLGEGVGEDELLRRPLARLLDLCRDRPEVDAQRLQQRFALEDCGTQTMLGFAIRSRPRAAARRLNGSRWRAPSHHRQLAAAPR